MLIHLFPFILFALITLYLLIKDVSVFFISFPLIKIMGTLLISTCISDIGGIYLYEINKYSVQSFSSYYLLFLYLTTLGIIYFFVGKVKMYKETFTIKYEVLINTGISFILTLLIFNVLITSFLL